jgi:hypothetical protein
MPQVLIAFCSAGQHSRSYNGLHQTQALQAEHYEDSLVEHTTKHETKIMVTRAFHPSYLCSLAQSYRRIPFSLECPTEARAHSGSFMRCLDSEHFVEQARCHLPYQDSRTSPKTFTSIIPSHCRAMEIDPTCQEPAGNQGSNSCDSAPQATPPLGLSNPSTGLACIADESVSEGLVVSPAALKFLAQAEQMRIQDRNRHNEGAGQQEDYYDATQSTEHERERDLDYHGFQRVEGSNVNMNEWAGAQDTELQAGGTDKTVVNMVKPMSLADRHMYDCPGSPKALHESFGGGSARSIYQLCVGETGRRRFVRRDMLMQRPLRVFPGDDSESPRRDYTFHSILD